MTTALAAAALLVALVALGTAFLAYRRADDTNVRVRGHLRDHEGPVRSHREGTPRERVPMPERRQVNLGAPREVGERRTVDLGPPTVEHPPPTTALPRLPRPGRIAQ